MNKRSKLFRQSHTERLVTQALRKVNKALKQDLLARTGRTTLPCDCCNGTGDDPLNAFAEPGELSKCPRCRGRGRRNPLLPTVLTDIEFGTGRDVLSQRGVGNWVAVRPVDDENTYLGIMLGDMATSTRATLDRQGRMAIYLSQFNPAMYVPDLKKVVFGYGSWWATIQSPDQLRKITNQDIDNVWYVKALKELGGQHAEN